MECFGYHLHHMIIMKFGGTSVSSRETIATICDQVKKERLRKPVVVVSAFSGVTNALVSLTQLSGAKKTEVIAAIRATHRKIADNVLADEEIRRDVMQYVDVKLAELTVYCKRKHFDKARIDTIISFGEIISSYIIAATLTETGIRAEQVIATKLIVTDSTFGSAEFIPNKTKTQSRKILIPFAQKGVVPVVTGFIGATVDGLVTTLGRGGSDYTASILGFCLEAKEIQIWTDVDGIFTADPRLVQTARALPRISYKEAAELAAFGAKVLHERTILPAIEGTIPVRVLNTFAPHKNGTIVSAAAPTKRNVITSIAFKKKITMVNLYSTDMLLQRGFLSRVFKIFADHGISVDLVSASEVSISVTLDNDEHIKAAEKEFAQFCAVTTRADMGMVSLIGDGIARASVTVEKIFATLERKKIPIAMISLGASDINVSLVMEGERVNEAVIALHKECIRL